MLIPQRPMKDVLGELKGKVGPNARSRLSAIYNLASQGRSPAQIVAELGLSQSDMQDVGRCIQTLGLSIQNRHQFADMSKVREEMLKKRRKG